MSSWHSYPKLYALGHKAIQELFYEKVLVQEKVDGSQFSFGKFKGELRVKSKNHEMSLDRTEQMFYQAVEYVKSIKDQLVDGWTYRGEYLKKPNHNVLCYDRIPKNHIILFDINDGEESYLPYEEVVKEAERLNLEAVPLLFRGKVSSYVDLENLLNTDSILGSQKVEGFVVKNYSRFGIDKKALMGKFVSERFKEQHKKEWGEASHRDSQRGIIEFLISKYRTEARWDKAIQHLRDAGQLEGAPKDIAKLIVEVPKDLIEECQDEIKEELFKWIHKDLMRGINRGLAEYYKEYLMKQQKFE